MSGAGPEGREADSRAANCEIQRDQIFSCWHEGIGFKPRLAEAMIFAKRRAITELKILSSSLSPFRTSLFLLLPFCILLFLLPPFRVWLRD